MKTNLQMQNEAYERQEKFEEIEDMIVELFKKCTKEGEKQNYASSLIHLCAIYGTDTIYEAVGIFECSKLEFIQDAKEVLED